MQVDEHSLAQVVSVRASSSVKSPCALRAMCSLLPAGKLATNDAGGMDSTRHALSAMGCRPASKQRKSAILFSFYPDCCPSLGMPVLAGDLEQWTRIPCAHQHCAPSAYQGQDGEWSPGPMRVADVVS